jgi:hypothetical protein
LIAWLLSKLEVITVNWDDEVDVVCTGAGAAGLASAISVVELGGEAFVADASASEDAGLGTVSVRPRIDRLQPWLGVDVADSPTIEYLDALTSDLGPLRRASWELDVPIRAVREPAPTESNSVVAPFVGSRLRDWTARCLASPYGFLFTRLSSFGATTLQTDDGALIPVAEIGSMTPDPADIGGSVLDWLAAQADERDIEIHGTTSLQRIVFEDGEAVGAVFTTPGRPLAIRARYGVVVTGGGSRTGLSTSYRLPATDEPLRVCVVGQHASRFGRVELLTSGPLDPPGPTNRPVNRRLRRNLHETQGQSHVWRCGKVHGYPPSGQ